MLILNEVERRKRKSIKTLNNYNIPYIKHLPVIQTEEETTLQEKEEICNRAICLALVAARGEGLELDIVIKKAKEFRVDECFTPEENAFMVNDSPNEVELAKFTWRYESLWVLLWGLHFINSLDKPNKVCDVELSVSTIVNRGRESFIQNSKLRSKKEILDQTDLYFRYHWATTEARIKNRVVPSDLEPGVVYERHYALNWLINYNNEEWDDVSTNT